MSSTAASSPGQSLLREPKTLTLYDPEGVRIHPQLRHRGFEELERRVAELDWGPTSESNSKVTSKKPRVSARNWNPAAPTKNNFVVHWP
jgi:hypothetical protein